MPDERIVTLATFGNPIEAELARNLLEAEGIRALLSGDTANNTLGGMVHTTIALQVAEGDADRALEALAEFGPHDRRREFLADAARAGPMRPEGAEEEEDTAIRVPEWASTEEPDEDDPEARYRVSASQFRSGKRPTTEERVQVSAPEPPAEKMAEPEPLEEPVRVTWGPDDYASRALKAAVLGPIVCLGLLNFYSVYLLIRLAFLDEEPSGTGMKKVYAAVAIDAVVVLTVLMYAASMVR